MKAVDQVLRVDEVAKLLKLSTKTVYRLAREGKIPAFKVGTDLRFKRQTIEELIGEPKPLDDSDDDQREAPSFSVTIIRTRCSEARCRNLGRVILRYADAGGRPMGNADFCLVHGRSRVERDRAAGLRVYDDREGPAGGSERRHRRV